MREAFKNGSQVIIHLIGNKTLIGEVKGQPAGNYVIVKEGASGREVCVNYDAITHVYPDVEKPKKHDPRSLKFTE